MAIDQYPPLSEEEVAFFYAEMAKLITEDDAPNNIFSERQQRLLLQLGLGAIAHEKMMHAIELLGTRVAPVVHTEIQRRTAAAVSRGK